MQRPQPRKREEEDYIDPRPVLVPPNRPKPGQQPCKYFARGNCARGDKCWFSHGSQGSHAPPVQLSPQQANASPEQAKAPPESRKGVGTLGQQQLIKRMLSDLVTQKAQRAASNQESGAKDNSSKDNSQQSARQRSAPPPEANSSPDNSGRAAVQNVQNGPSHRPHPSEGRSTPGNLSRAAEHNGQNGPSPRPNAPHVSGSTGGEGRGAALQNDPRQYSSPPKGSSNPGIIGRPAVPPYQHRGAAPRPQPSSSMGNNRPMPQQYSDRHMAQQKKVPYVPVVPKSDLRYKTTLCVYHKQGCCPRGDSCSFAHSISELRKKPQTQGLSQQNFGPAAPSDGSVSADGEGQPPTVSAASKSQPESSAASSSAQAAQQEEPPQEAPPKPKPQGLPPLIQQLLSRTAPTRPPASAAPPPQSSTSQSQPPASSVPWENSAGATPVSQSGTASAEATFATPGPVLLSLIGGAPQLPVKFGSMSPLPPPQPASSSAPEAQASMLKLLQGQPKGQQSSAPSAVPNQQIATFLDLGTAQHSRPAEQSAGSSQRRPQPKAACPNGPAQQAGGPTAQVAQVIAAGAAHTSAHMQQLPATPAASASPRLANAPSRSPPKATQPHSAVSEGAPAALQRPQPQQRRLSAPEVHTGGHMQHPPASVAASMPPQKAYSPSTDASQPAQPGAVQRQQPSQRPQPVQRPQPNGIQRLQPSTRAPPPGFSSRPGTAQTGEGVTYPGAGLVHQPSLARSGDGSTYTGTDSAQQPECRKPNELHSATVQTKGMGPMQAAIASKGATASLQPESAAEESSKAPPQTLACKEAKAQPSAKPLGEGIHSQSSSSSSMRNGHPTANGSLQSSGHSASTGTVHSKAWRDAQDRQLHRRAVLKAGDPDDLPDSFCCPITHELLRNPVVAVDGHTYEAWAIASWLESHDTSPMTNEEMSSKEVAPNKSLKDIIDLLYPMEPIRGF